MKKLFATLVASAVLSMAVGTYVLPTQEAQQAQTGNGNSARVCGDDIRRCGPTLPAQEAQTGNSGSRIDGEGCPPRLICRPKTAEGIDEDGRPVYAKPGAVKPAAEGIWEDGAPVAEGVDEDGQPIQIKPAKLVAEGVDEDGRHSRVAEGVDEDGRHSRVAEGVDEDGRPIQLKPAKSVAEGIDENGDPLA